MNHTNIDRRTLTYQPAHAELVEARSELRAYFDKLSMSGVQD